MNAVTIVLLLGVVWLAANLALVLMLRRSARARGRELGHAPALTESATARPAFGKALGRP